jgi:plastocyanin
MPKLLRIGLLAVILGAAAAPPAEGQQPRPAAVVEMSDRLVYEPATLRIQPGQTVTWRNTTQLVHTVTADPARAIVPAHASVPRGAATFDSGDIPPGGEFTHTFEVPGTYRYFCVPHELASMIGTIEVGP